jgi:2-keto-4-pentenoate hydratase
MLPLASSTVVKLSMEADAYVCLNGDVTRHVTLCDMLRMTQAFLPFLDNR